MSMSKMYLALLSSPETRHLKGGNILLQRDNEKYELIKLSENSAFVIHLTCVYVFFVSQL